MFWIIVLLIPLLFGFNFILRVFQPAITKEYANEKIKGGINIVSYNVHGFVHSDKHEEVISAENSFAMMNSCLDLVKEYKPDVICFQEFQMSKKIKKTAVRAKIKNLKYSVLDSRLKSSRGGFGLAIYSAYPILKSGSIEFENSANSMIWADLLVAKGDTLRVFNNHLQSNTIGALSLKYIEDHKFVSSKNDSLEFNIFDKLTKNSVLRANQVDSVAPLIYNSPYPVVVCGDFNDPPMSYTYRVMRGDLVDSFREKGRGISSTYNGLFNILRIDYVFHSRGYTTESYSVPVSALSDHNPVVVNIKRDK